MYTTPEPQLAFLEMLSSRSEAAASACGLLSDETQPDVGIERTGKSRWPDLFLTDVDVELISGDPQKEVFDTEQLTTIAELNILMANFRMQHGRTDSDSK